MSSLSFEKNLGFRLGFQMLFGFWVRIDIPKFGLGFTFLLLLLTEKFKYPLSKIHTFCIFGFFQVCKKISDLG